MTNFEPSCKFGGTVSSVKSSFGNVNVYSKWVETQRLYHRICNWAQNWSLVKNPQFLLYCYKTLAKWSTHEQVVMLQYELDQITIKCFFQMKTFDPSSKFDGTVSSKVKAHKFATSTNLLLVLIRTLIGSIYLLLTFMKSLRSLRSQSVIVFCLVPKSLVRFQGFIVCKKILNYALTYFFIAFYLQENRESVNQTVVSKQCKSIWRGKKMLVTVSSRRGCWARITNKDFTRFFGNQFDQE